MAERDETLLCCIGVNSDAGFGAVMPPLYLSANYSFDGYEGKREYDYTRSGNPTRSVLADALTQLEGGAGTAITSSGMSAVDLALSLLDSGARVIAPHDCYGGTWRLLTARAKKRQVDVVFIDQSDADAVETALSAGAPALLWIETPSNPLMRVVDIEALAKRAKAVGAKVAVDNTFLSPLLQKPIALGADFVVHSTTKYLNGHSDVVGGAVIAASAEDAAQLTWWANCTGVTGAPFDCWLTLRGLRTLSVRLERQGASAAELARRLTRHEGVRRVHYPGLEAHPTHAIAAKQQAGFGAMLSFEIAAPAATAAPAFVRAIKRFTLAESLGGVESLVAHPATMTHASMSAEARVKAGFDDSLFRLSIGLEHVEDLWADLSAALDATRPAGGFK
ncbi:MAG: cystathionine gamma-synthase [Proteobacteria bacterium]|nr:cystathionine gamma-synthase [Pseudomonadota bacterium]